MKTKTFNKMLISLCSIFLLLFAGIVMLAHSAVCRQSSVQNGTVFATSYNSVQNDSTHTTVGYVVYEKTSDSPKTAQVVGYLSSMPPNSSITIESSVTINGASEYSVTGIASGAFIGCTSLSKLVLPESITNFGSGAFKDCINLESFDIKIEGEYIIDSIFWNCSNLNYARIDFVNESLIVTCGMIAMENGNESLKTIYMQGGSNDVVSAGVNFAACTALKSITIPSCFKDGGEEWESQGMDVVPMEGYYPTDLREIYMASSTALTGLMDTWDEYTVSTTGVLTKVQSAVSATNVLGGANCATKHYIRSDVSSSDIFVLEMQSDSVLDANSSFYTLSADGKTAYKVCVKGSVFGELPTSNGQELNWEYSGSDVVWHSDVSSSIAANDGAKYVLSVAASNEETGVVANIILPSILAVTLTTVVAMYLLTFKRKKRI